MPKSEHIYIGADRVPFRMRWKPIDRGKETALEAEQIELLATRFSISIDDLKKLSRDLTTAVDSAISPNGVFVARSKAAERGAKEYDRVLKGAAAAERHLANALAKLDRLHADDRIDGDFADEFWETMRSLHECHDGLNTTRLRMAAIAKNPEVVLLIAPDDRRSLHDPRRERVLFGIFRFWESIDRKVAFTTDPNTSERRGDLIDFVNAVVGCITVPPGHLTGDAIIDSIKAFRTAAGRRR